MVKTFGVVVAAVLLSTGKGMNAHAVSALTNHRPPLERSSDDQQPLDVNALLTAARGAPPLICSLASESVRGNNWGDWSDAPSTPLAPVSLPI